MHVLGDDLLWTLSSNLTRMSWPGIPVQANTEEIVRRVGEVMQGYDEEDEEEDDDDEALDDDDGDEDDLEGQQQVGLADDVLQGQFQIETQKS